MKIFIGFDYDDFFVNIINSQLSPFIESTNNEPIFPLNKEPGGDLILRIFKMIEECNITFWECTTFNPNVFFELGYALGIRKPYFILFKKNFSENNNLSILLKTQWGIWYNDIEELKKKLKNIINVQYPLGTYSHETNKILNVDLNKGTKLNSIGVVLDSNFNYDEELKIIFKVFKNSKINLIQVENYGSISHLFTDIEQNAVIISLLSDINVHEEFKDITNNANSLKLIVTGIAKGLQKECIIIQKGEKTYSDIQSFTKIYSTHIDFENVLNEWVSNISQNIVINNLISTRIGIPRLGKLIERKRITDLIKNNLFSKIIYIRTPSGYGKTAVALNVINQLEGNKIWYTFDKNVKSIEEFIKDILISISKYYTDIGKSFNFILSSYYKREITDIILINYFLGELKKIDKKIILVLDDIHVLNRKPFNPLFSELFKNQIKNCGIIILSREDLVEENYVYDGKYLINLKKEDIVFNESEINEYFENLFSIKLSKEEISTLSNKTEGWIACLSLLSIIIIQKGKNSIHEIIERLKGTDKKIYDYFADIVYDNFSQNIQSNLKYISIPLKLNPKVTSYLLSIPENESLNFLNKLEEQNSFLFNYENDPFVFKFHNLFREFLIKKFEVELGSDELIKQKYNLSDFYFNSKDYYESLSFGLEGNNFGSIVKTISAIGNALIDAGLTRFIYEIINKVPEKNYHNNYSFNFIKGRCEDFIGERNLALETYKKAQKLIEVNDKNNLKERNFIKFLILQLEIIQNHEKTYLPTELKEIIENSKKINDLNTFFISFGLYAQIKRIRLMIHSKETTNINKDEIDLLIKEIDGVINDLEECSFNFKSTYIPQLLVDKSMLYHTLAWYNAMNSQALKRLSKNLRVEISNKRDEEIKREFDEYIKKEASYFNEALKIAIKDNNDLLKANILVSRAETYDSWNVYLFHSTGLISQELFNNSIKDQLLALRIYSNLGHNYGIANIYNNIAQTYLLNNDKLNRDKFANFAFKISSSFGFNDIIKSSIDILNSPTIEENLQEAFNRFENDFKENISEENEKRLEEYFMELFDDLSNEEKEKRRLIYRQESADFKIGLSLKKNWCNYINVFYTNLSLSKHPSTGIKIIESYLNMDGIAIKLYKERKCDFSELNAKFIYCTYLNLYSNSLDEKVERSSEEFIKKFCINCKYKEVNIF